MSVIQAVFFITTPMFLGGADITAPAELRPASIKGLLRFWFRATQYGRYKDVAALWKEENALFGSTASQSRIFLKLAADVKAEVGQDEIKDVFSNGSTRYLGYGLDYGTSRDPDGIKYRSFLAPEGTFNVDLLIKPRHRDKVDKDALLKSLQALGLFGGLGSRSRRGFGSITLTSLQVNGEEFWDPPKTREDLQARLQDFYGSIKLCPGSPEFTAFCKETRTIILSEHASYSAALQEVGEALQRFRRDYKADARLVSRYIREGKAEGHPERVVFGLPHNYYFRDVGEAGIAPKIDSKPARRASPLFIKIIGLKKNNSYRYAPVLTIFPAQFLPAGIPIELSGKRRSGHRIKPVQVKPAVSLALIEQFMASFPTRLEVKPLG